MNHKLRIAFSTLFFPSICIVFLVQTLMSMQHHSMLSNQPVLSEITPTNNIAVAAPDQVTPADLAEIGVLDVTAPEFNADPDGVRDSTIEISRALKAAYDRQMVLFFPPGEYLVSDTLAGIKAHDTRRDFAHVLVGSTAGESRPVIRLNDNAPGFGNPNDPKPVILLATQNISTGKYMPANGFNQGIRGIDIVVGTGNEGAIGLWHEGAQDSFVMNTTITMHSGFAGLYNLIGTSSVLTNIEIVGGKYGIYAPEARWPSITNLTLRNQTDYAIYKFQSGGPLTITGFQIQKESAPVIKTFNPGQYWSKNYGGGNISLIDGTIELAEINDEPAIINMPQNSETISRSLLLHNVYFRNAGKLIQSGSNTAVSGGAGWYHVAEYAYPIEAKNENNEPIGVILFDAQIKTQEYIGSIAPGSAPDTDLRLRHALDEADYPSPDVILTAGRNGSTINGLSVANVKDHGVMGAGSGADDTDCTGPDDTAALQAVIDNFDIVLLPKGKYLVSNTILLRENTHLIGVANYLSEIRAHADWQPTMDNPGLLIETVNSTSAKTRLSFIKLGWITETPEYDWFDGIHWKAGRNSVVLSLTIRPLWGPVDIENCPSCNPKTMARITDHGGGRWYGAGFISNGNRNYHEGNRRLMIEGTHEPLIFYGLNIEDGHGTWQSEVINASNIAIYGFKSEDPNVMRISNTHNFIVFGWGGDIKDDHRVENPGYVFKFENDSSQILMGSLAPRRYSAANSYVLSETAACQTTNIGIDRVVALFKRGTVSPNCPNTYLPFIVQQAD